MHALKIFCLSSKQRPFPATLLFSHRVKTHMHGRLEFSRCFCENMVFVITQGEYKWKRNHKSLSVYGLTCVGSEGVLSIDQTHKFQKSPIPNSTTQFFVTEMYTHGNISVTTWCIQYEISVWCIVEFLSWAIAFNISGHIFVLNSICWTLGWNNFQT